MVRHRMLYGYYPEVVTSPGEEQVVLKELVNSYLYKDILALESINKADKLVRLVQALAMQIGTLVSYNEIAQIVGLNAKTVEKYIDVLEKCFIVFRLGTFSRNLRNELKSSRKVYFWDLGVRNAVIANFQQVESRADVGSLWGNYVIAERMKLLNAQGRFVNSWFWRTQQQSEIDLLEEENGEMRSYEIKWNPKKKSTRIPLQFAKNYPDAKFEVITPDNVERILKF